MQIETFRDLNHHKNELQLLSLLAGMPQVRMWSLATTLPTEKSMASTVSVSDEDLMSVYAT